MKAYRFLEEADQEFHEQIGYYLGHSLSAAEKFVDEVHAAVRDIREYPQSGSPISRLVRQRVLTGHKYSVLYIDTPKKRQRRIPASCAAVAFQQSGRAAYGVRQRQLPLSIAAAEPRRRLARSVTAGDGEAPSRAARLRDAHECHVLAAFDGAAALREVADAVPVEARALFQLEGDAGVPEFVVRALGELPNARSVIRQVCVPGSKMLLLKTKTA